LIGCLRMKVEEQTDYKIRLRMMVPDVRNRAKVEKDGCRILHRS
jgi:hypothetical protein